MGDAGSLAPVGSPMSIPKEPQQSKLLDFWWIQPHHDHIAFYVRDFEGRETTVHFPRAIGLQMFEVLSSVLGLAQPPSPDKPAH